MIKRIVSLIISFIILICPFQSYAFASEEQSGYIEILANGQKNSYAAIVQNGEIFLKAKDLSIITGYDYSNNSDNITFDKLGDLDYVTSILIELDGKTYTMGEEYNIDLVFNEDEIFLPLEKMLYLTHCQWCVEENALTVQPLPYTLLDFAGSQYLDSLFENKVNQTDLLINGESELAHNLRSSLAAVFNDFDPMMFIIWWPGEGFSPALNDEYEEALLQLSIDDMEFLDTYGCDEISRLLEESGIEEISSAVNDLSNLLNVPDNILDATYDLDDTIQWLSKETGTLKSLKFNVYNDFSSFTDYTFNSLSDVFQDASKEVGKASEVLDIINMISSISEVLQRSKQWGDDFIDQISILTDFENMGYNTSITDRVKKVANQLIEEYKDPIHASADETSLQATSFFLGKVFDESMFGKFFSIFSTGLAIMKTNQNIKDSIDGADLSYMVDCLIKTEQIAVNETNRSCSDIWATSVTDGLDEKEISRFRNCLMLSLRTNLRNRAFIYYLNQLLNDESNWESSEQAQTIREQIIEDYTSLCIVMETEPTDRLLILDSFSNMYSEECGKMREKISTDIFHEGEISQTSSIDLNQSYWEYMIQSHKVFKFNADGTMEEYDCDPGVTPTEQNISYWKTHHYTWDGKQLVITWDEGYQTILEPVTIDDDINWDIGLRNQLSEIPSGEVFFYETDWQQDNQDDNAMYLVKVKDASETEEEASKYYGTWEADPNVTMELTGNSLMSVYGSGIKYGSEIIIREDGFFSFNIGIAADNQGEGTWTWNGNGFNYTLTSTLNQAEVQGDLTIVPYNGTDYLVMNDRGKDIYWRQTNSSVESSVPSSENGIKEGASANLSDSNPLDFISGAWDSYDGDIRLIFNTTGLNYGITMDGIQSADGTMEIINLQEVERTAGSFTINENSLSFVAELQEENVPYSYNDGTLKIGNVQFHKVDLTLINQLIGTWKGDNGTIIFGDKNEMSLFDNDNPEMGLGYYVVLNESELNVRIDGDLIRAVPYHITGTTLEFNGYTLYKDGTDSSFSSTEEFKQILIGTWARSGTDIQDYYTFRDDGTYEYYSTEGSLKAKYPSLKGFYEIQDTETIYLYPDRTSLPIVWKYDSENGLNPGMDQYYHKLQD